MDNKVALSNFDFISLQICIECTWCWERKLFADILIMATKLDLPLARRNPWKPINPSMKTPNLKLSQLSFLSFFGALLIFIGPLYSQPDSGDWEIDSLKTLLHAAKKSNEFDLAHQHFSSIEYAFEVINMDSSIAWSLKHLSYLKQTPANWLKKDSALGSAYLNTSYLFTTFSYPSDSQAQAGIAYSDTAIEIFSQISYDALLGYSYNNKSCFHYSLGEFEKSAEALNKALELSAVLRDTNQQAYLQQSLWLNIGRSQIGLKQWKQASRSTKIAMRRHNHMPFVNACQLNLSAIYIERNMIDSALFYSERAYALADSLDYLNNKLLASTNIVECLYDLKKFDEALDRVDKMIALLNEVLPSSPLLATSYHQKAKVLKSKGEINQAISLLLKALSFTENTSDLDFQEGIYGNLAEFSFEAGDYKKAYSYQQKFHRIKDSLKSIEDAERFNQLLVEYESSEKERKISQQDLELQTLNASINEEKARTIQLTLLFLFIASLGFIAFIRYRQIQIRKHQKAIIQEQENGMSAMISATEEERKRISKDLHDGIGQNLTALKLGLLHLVPKAQNEELEKELEEISEEFTKSAEAVRRISHQMMPRALMEQGLVSALEDLLESSFKYSPIQYQFEQHGLQKRYPEKLEVSLYRISQELINNVIKHSKATTIELQLMQIANKLILIIEDNGEGLKPNNSKGHGLLNVKSRLEYLKGTFNLEDSPSSGMLATVTIPLKWWIL